MEKSCGGQLQGARWHFWVLVIGFGIVVSGLCFVALPLYSLQPLRCGCARCADSAKEWQSSVYMCLVCFQGI